MSSDDPVVPDAHPNPHDLPETARRVHASIDALAVSVNNLAARVWWRTRIFAVSLAGSVLLTAAVVALTANVYTTNECQAATNTAFTTALTERDEATTRERLSMRRLLDVILTPDATDGQRAAALARYREGLLAADRQRTENPLPTSGC